MFRVYPFLLAFWFSILLANVLPPSWSHSSPSPSRHCSPSCLTLSMLVLSFYYSFMACIYTDFYHPCFFALCHLLQVAPEWLKNYFEKFRNAILINRVDALLRLFHTHSIVWYGTVCIYNYIYIYERCTCWRWLCIFSHIRIQKSVAHKSSLKISTEQKVTTIKKTNKNSSSSNEIRTNKRKK